MNTYFFINTVNQNQIEISADNLGNAIDMLEVNYENWEDYYVDKAKTIIGYIEDQVIAKPKPIDDFYRIPKYHNKFFIEGEVKTTR